MSERETGKTSNKWTTRDILYIIVLALIGAIYSTYLPLGTLVSTALPTIPGSGWLVTGIHTMFVLLAFGLTLKKFSNTAAGTIKGLFELIFGNTRIGVMIIVQGAIAGLIIDCMYFIFMAINEEKAKNDEGKLSWIFPWILGPAIANATALPIFYSILGLLANPNLMNMLWVMMLIAFASGAVFGALARVIRELIIKSAVPSNCVREKTPDKKVDSSK